MKKKIIGYVRTSYRDIRSFKFLRYQKKCIKELAKKHGDKIDEFIQDTGSNKNLDLKGMVSLIAMIKNNEVDKLYVMNEECFTDYEEAYFTLHSLCIKYKVKIMSCRPSIMSIITHPPVLEKREIKQRDEKYYETLDRMTKLRETVNNRQIKNDK